MEGYKINTPHIVSEIFADEEAAVINLKTGNYYSLNTTAAEIWSLIEKGSSKSRITKYFFNNFNLEDSFDSSEIERFIKALIDEDLIVVEEMLTSGQAELVEDTATGLKDKREYVPPVLECYADMQELLLLDPIHEVEETNWLVTTGDNLN
jgi:hypothetical protein